MKKIHKNKDISLLIKLCRLTTREVMLVVRKKALECGYQNKDIHLDPNFKYLYIEGDDKTYPVFVAHADTVRDITSLNIAPVNEFFYDGNMQVLWSPDLAGFDDRAGIAAIMKLIGTTDHRFPILILDKEEVGGLGAIDFCSDYTDKEGEPLRKFKFFVELDRQGYNDSVFYGCKNSFFEFYINSFGFETQKGSFSDISYLAPIFNCAGVNLSIGYKDEHTFAERLYLEDFYETINKIKHLLDTAEKTPYFIYI